MFNIFRREKQKELKEKARLAENRRLEDIQKENEKILDRTNLEGEEWKKTQKNKKVLVTLDDGQVLDAGTFKPSFYVEKRYSYNQLLGCYLHKYSGDYGAQQFINTAISKNFIKIDEVLYNVSCIKKIEIKEVE